MPDAELYGTKQCPHTQDARDWLEWNRRDFVEFDVEADTVALDRMLALTAGQRTVPVLVEQGKVVEIGWRGRGCAI